jgi:heme/copper-type cytochrome/quinol oxidase subunit 1
VVIYLSMNPTIRAECRKLSAELRTFFVSKILFCANGGGSGVVHPNPSANRLFHPTTHAVIHTIT